MFTKDDCMNDFVIMIIIIILIMIKIIIIIIVIIIIIIIIIIIKNINIAFFKVIPLHLVSHFEWHHSIDINSKV